MPIERVGSFDRQAWADKADRWAFGALFAVVAAISFSNSLFEISSSVFTALSIGAIVLSRRHSAFTGVLAKLIMTYFAANLISLLQSDYLSESLKGIFRILREALLCLSTVHVMNSESRFKKIFQFFSLVAIFIGIDALIQSATGIELIRHRSMTPYYEKTGRLTGPFHHANDFSAYLSFTVFLFIGILQEGYKFFSRGKYIFYWVGFFIIFICLVGTYSRGAWLAVLGATILFAVFKRSKWFLAGVIAVALWGAFFSPPLIQARVSSAFNTTRGTLVERSRLWQESLRLIRINPWFGLGVNTYARNVPHVKAKEYKIDNQYAHNGYLQMTAEIGVVGLAAFLTLIFYFIATTLGSFKTRAGSFLETAGTALAFGIVSFLFHSATETNLQSLLLVNTLWLAMGMAWAARMIAQKSLAS